MRIGIISNSELCIPLLQYLKTVQAGVCLFSGAMRRNPASAQKLTGFCDHFKIPITEEKTAESLYRWNEEHQPAMLVVIDYDQRIDVSRLSSNKAKLYNIHFGNLPEYRGANPLFWQIKERSTSFGITIHELSQQMDAGAIMWTKQVQAEDWFTYTLLNQLLSQSAVEGAAQLIQAHLKNIPVSGKPQDKANARHYPRPQLADVRINWSSSAEEILALVRACSDWNSGAIAEYFGMEVKIMDAYCTPGENHNKPPGTILSVTNTVEVAVEEDKKISITALRVNDLFVPPRLAHKFGFKTATSFN